MEQNEVKDKDELKVDFVKILPVELAEKIFLCLSPRDLAACSAVCSSWREATNSNRVWGFLCEKNGWKDDLDPKISHFYRAHKQFRKMEHSTNDALSNITTMCQKRLLFNKHSWLRRNFREGIYLRKNIFNTPEACLHLEPICCDGRYVIFDEKKVSNNEISIGVWSMDGDPSRICDLPLSSQVRSVDDIAFDHATIALAEAGIITVFQLKNEIFEKSFEKRELKGLEPKNNLIRDLKPVTAHLKITNDFIICVPNHSHSTVDSIPILFWDRVTGTLKHTLSFDFTYHQISNPIWFKDSCYLSLTNESEMSYQIVEFGIKTPSWKEFTQSVPKEVEQVVVGEKYVLAVTKRNSDGLAGDAITEKKLWLWNRVTGSHLKTIYLYGKGFTFHDDYLVYYSKTSSMKIFTVKVTDSDRSHDLEVPGPVTTVRVSPHPGIIVISKAKGSIEVWDWRLGCRLYTISLGEFYGRGLWVDDKSIMVYPKGPESTAFHRGGLLLLSFW